jgi:hypothetical protein
MEPGWRPTEAGHLNLGHNKLDDEGLRELLSAPRLVGFTRLNLAGNEIPDAGAEALADSPHLANLVSLNLSGNRITTKGGKALLASSSLAAVRSLVLTTNCHGLRRAGHIDQRAPKWTQQSPTPCVHLLQFMP